MRFIKMKWLLASAVLWAMIWGVAHANNIAGVGLTLTNATSAATPTPSGGVLPDGVSSPQSGSWVIQVNDNFNTDSSINTALWNGGYGASVSPGYDPECHPDGGTDDCAGIDGCNGYAGLDSGGQECGQVYTAQNGAGNTINSTGLQVQDYNNFAGLTSPGTQNGGLPYNSNELADLQNYGNVNLQPGSFVEWRAQMPHDNSGEGDGLHTDLWCTNNSRIGGAALNSDEVDVAEQVWGTGNHQDQTSSVFDYTANGDSSSIIPGSPSHYTFPGSPDLTAGMHTYGMWWQTGGGTYGQVILYADGVETSGPTPLSDVGWGTGVYCYAGWMQQSPSWAGYNGSTIDSSTADTGDPLQVQYFRYWKQN